MSTPKQNVTINLLKNGVVVDTAVTDVNGNVVFQNVVAGTYDCEIVNPTGYVLDDTNVENVIADSNNANDQFVKTIAKSTIKGIDVVDGTTALASVVITNAISVALVIVSYSAHDYSIKFSSPVAVPENVVIDVTHFVTQLINTIDTQISQTVDSQLTILQGQTDSETIACNAVALQGYLFDDTCQLHTVITNVTPGRTVVDTSNNNFPPLV